MTDVDMIQSLAGCTLEEAERSLEEFKTVEAAVDALLTRPVTSGSKYIPQPRKIDSGTTPEQEAICALGRALMDKLTAVSSAAQTKIQSGQTLAEDAVQQVSPVQQAKIQPSSVE
jgi:hypothetical protein